MTCENPSPLRGTLGKRLFALGGLSNPALHLTGREEVNHPRESSSLLLLLLTHVPACPAPFPPGGSTLPSPRLPVSQVKIQRQFPRHRALFAGAERAPGSKSRGFLRARIGCSVSEPLVSLFTTLLCAWMGRHVRPYVVFLASLGDAPPGGSPGLPGALSIPCTPDWPVSVVAGFKDSSGCFPPYLIQSRTC